MTDRDDRIRRAFTASPDDPELDRERVWTGVVRVRARVARYRRAIRTSLAAVAVLAGLMLMRNDEVRTAVLSRLGMASAPAASTVVVPTTEDQVTNQALQADPNLIQLLEHRRNLRSDMDALRLRYSGLENVIELQANHPKIQDFRNELRRTVARIDAVNTELRFIDLQLAQHSSAPALATPEAVATTTTPPVVANEGILVERVLALSGLGGALLLLCFATVLYVRRSIRATTIALSAMQAQASARHEALAAGIDAIALEVERLGESQRYMSKQISGGSEGQAAGLAVRKHGA